MEQLLQEINSQLETGKLSEDVKIISVNIPSIVEPEEEHALTLRVWYKYVQNGEEKKGNYQKALGKITLINPG